MRPLLTAAWRDLVMLSYEVTPATLAPLVPAGVELDLWHGHALVTAVGFQFLDTRIHGFAVPLHRSFAEVNLRFYVRREVGTETRRGVVFIRELVTPPLVAMIARWRYNEPYEVAAVRRAACPEGRYEYGWRRYGTRGRVAATAYGDRAVPPRGSQPAFVTQRHWGYTRQRDGTTIEYYVSHPPWRVRAARDPLCDGDTTGIIPAGDPMSALVVDGSGVEVTAPDHLVA
jgi:uncharacterized protein YqjF (DUF2071 family)